jgi:uroporphyrin-III C-methyltransferase / precorrin-2 dehydrogenase / sirohydrochlorin ferrochelatase
MRVESGSDEDGSETPADSAIDAIRPLATLPLFFKLQDRAALVAGGGDGAAWKAELLTAAGADVVVYARETGPRMLEIAGRRDTIRIVPRRWASDDLRGAALAILETEDDEEARAFRSAARAAGVAVNVIDRPEFCDFSFASLVNRSPLVVAISTDGAAPVFAQAIRARIEALLPASFAQWAEAAREWRRRLDPLGLDFRQRRSFWERFVDLALGSGGRAPQSSDFEALTAAQAKSEAPAEGQIILVGAGPGDPELLTLKAVRALQSADVVLYDRLSPPAVLELARREARRIDVGKRGPGRSIGQDEISKMLVDLAREGKTVVRLKGGDPGVFGRAHEEVEAARAAGVRCTIIPGVTTALAAAAALGISLSDPARRIQFVTARDADGALPEGLEWRALVDADATTAVYMGVGTLPALAARLLAEGLDPETPAALMENVGLPEARQRLGPIARLPEIVAAEPPAGPCLLLYGRALAGVEARAP